MVQPSYSWHPGPAAPKGYPEEPIEPAQRRSGILTLQHEHLLARGQNLQRRSCRDRRNAPAHSNTLTTKRNTNRLYSTIGRIRRVGSLSKLLILRLNSILATDSSSLRSEGLKTAESSPEVGTKSRSGQGHAGREVWVQRKRLVY